MTAKPTKETRVPFEYILDRVTGNDPSVTDYIMVECMAKCTNLGAAVWINANVKQISTDATAADNAEVFFDGTGYDGTGNTIPTVTTTGTVTTVSDKTGYRLSATGVDDILDEPITEPSAAFTWSGSLRSIIGWIGALARNKVTQPATTQTLRNDADNANLSTSTHSDDGTTHTRGEWS
jgi:hypothetical protein